MAFYTRIHEEHWLRDKLEEGRIVVLEDESIWEVHPSDRQITKRWLRISTITLKHTQKRGLSVSCRPQKVDLALCSNFLKPVFMVQSTENVLASDPARGWQFVSTNSRGSPRMFRRIWNPWS
jgi:hypothetical protein